MSWADVDASKVSATIEPVPVGEYVFELLPGTALDAKNRINLSANIVEGPFAGRRLYFSYPDPSQFDWSPRIAKRLVIALGEDVTEGENFAEVFNRAAGKRFSAPVKDGKVSEAYPTPKRELDIFKVKASA